MSALFHLVEAATALSQLGESNLSPSTAYRAASTSSTLSTSATPTSPVPATSFVSDDDETLANKAACTKIAILRENHLQALRAAAAANAGLATTTSVSAAPDAVRPIRPPPMALAAPAPLATAAPATLRARQQETSSSGPATMKPPRRSGVVVVDSSTAAGREIFPMRLHELLADPTVRDVISWLPHGRSFVILRPDVFANRVLPRYFANEGYQMKAGVHKYPSFTRKLNRWGFRQTSRGPDAGAFCHDLFQRDDPGLCRGMVCQKSRKSFSSSSSFRSGQFDDVMSVSSSSTMGTAGNRSVTSFGTNRGGEKRLYSSTVTVSTAGQNNNGNASVCISNKSLPFKKRKSNGQVVSMMNDIPSMISHGYQKMSSSTTSMTESDLTSDNGSVCSGGNNNSNAVSVAPKAASKNVALCGNNPLNIAEALAREALARHFHEQHRAFALASLMENSRLAIEAAGLAGNDQQQTVRLNPDPSVSASAAVVVEQKKTEESLVSVAAATPMASISLAESARAALYKAFMQAMNCDDAAATASSSSSSCA
ncbi:hypothetical protein ACHAW5_004130 [Stephanodiscus triporus]|uniref:HSF-type DNA-binding domain-containing protein n=1 Tax=Stephanodiscus triporus TaxID=2934178 RepID=A0ABD3QEQ5_9STRA